MVLELVPEQLAAAITERLRVPTIGIGAGAGCSGQVQVVTDLLGMSAEFTPKHARHYTELHSIIKTAAEAYRADVIAGTFPGPGESTRIDAATLDEILGRTTLDRPEMVEASRGIPLDRDL
jgi:3-methyl-2-oxobutanoate hydroxymethyltransferase